MKMSRLTPPAKKKACDYYRSITDCQKENLNKDSSNNKQCNFKGLCIHQSILIRGIKYCLRA
jgi:hypothetical protein